MADQYHVFVYGTLKVGGYFATQFDKFRTKSIDARLRGYKLMDLGAYPAIIESDNHADMVYGELHSYDSFPSVQRAMDMIEGYKPNDPEGGLYCRKRELAEGADAVMHHVFVYYMDKDSEIGKRIMSSANVIPEGVWHLRPMRAS